MRREYVAAWVILVLVIAGVLYYIASQKAPEGLAPETEAAMTVPAEVYISEEGGFSIRRPASAIVQEDGSSTFTTVSERFYAGIGLIPELFEGTNLKEATVFVVASSSTGAVEGCEAESEQTAETRVGELIVASTTFAIFHTTGAAGEETYDVTRYRALHDASCFELAAVLHVVPRTNVWKVQEFPKETYAGLLERIVETFEFLR